MILGLGLTFGFSGRSGTWYQVYRYTTSSILSMGAWITHNARRACYFFHFFEDLIWSCWARLGLRLLVGLARGTSYVGIVLIYWTGLPGLLYFYF